MEFTHPAERRIKDLLNEETVPLKRKLESTVSTDRFRDLKKKDKIIKENTIADITLHGRIQEDVSLEDASMTSEPIPLDKSLTQTISRGSREMDVEQTEEIIDQSLEGAACAEIIEESKKNEVKKPNKVKRTVSSVGSTVLEGINEETLTNKENEGVKEKPESKTTPKKKTIKKKVLTDKNETSKSKTPPKQTEEDVATKNKVVENENNKKDEETKPMERRKSRIFEAAEKFQNMISPTNSKPQVVEKPKKIVIPGVSVGGFKKEFERKASLTSTSPPKIKTAPTKKLIIDAQQKSTDQEEEENLKIETKPEQDPKTPDPDDRNERLRTAVNIISSALDKEGTRKSKSRPCCIRKPPVPFGASGRSASGNIGLLTSPLSPPPGPRPFVKAQLDKAEKVEEAPEPFVEENKTSSAEITLKSATLPRRKTTKAEIHLNYPVPKPATMEFKTEMAHNVAAVPKMPTQRSEVVVPVAAAQPNLKFR